MNLNIKTNILIVSLLLIPFKGVSAISISNIKANNKTINKSHKSEKSESDFINELLRKMTLEEKIGQLSQYVGKELLTGPLSKTLSDSLLERGMIGSVLNIGGVEKIKRVQELNMKHSRLKIPILFGFDVIHGFKTIFPVPLAEASSWDLDLMRRTAKAASIEASASGIHWTFAPMVDIARDPRWGRIVEGAGEDTYLGCKIADARVRGFQWNLWQPNSVMACAKHFAVYGAPQGGVDYAPVDVSNTTLFETYLPPYKACIDAGVQTFMSAFNDVNGMPATGSKFLLTDLLRKQWGFKGFVVSDWAAVAQLKNQGVVANEEDAGTLALNAGLDMNMTDGVYNAHLAEAIKKGKVSIETVDESVRRILRVKYRLGLFKDPYRFLDLKREKQEIRNDSIMKLAREAACKSVVLLKNDKDILPLSKRIKRIALIGPLANDQNELMGSWKARGEKEDVVTVLQGIKNKSGNGIDIKYIRGCDWTDSSKAEFSEAVKIAKESDVVIAVVGEKALMSGEDRSRAYLNLPGVQEELLEELKKSGKPVITVLMNGRPLTLANVVKSSDALLETWFLGTQAGNAIADILFGDYNPSGKLTVSFPYAEGQIPNYYNYKRSGRPTYLKYIDLKKDNLFPFGFGLSYTKFTYSNLQCPPSFDSQGKAIVSIDVTNNGNYDGEETVQLYVADKVASMVRPVKELKGFKKVFIPKGKTIKVDIELNSQELGFWTNDMKYVVEPGEFNIMVGPNSEQLTTQTIILK
uniref:beta-glucosidase n=1 Tax=Prevotella sp. GTC17254 TaxID=3236794 RepID=A0AB33J1R9_9BACT